MSGWIMAQMDSASEVGSPAATDLEPYRRLIALQKEIIRLAEQNERAKKDCLALLNHVTNKGQGQATAPRTLRQRVNKAFGQLPMFPAKPNLVPLVIKEEMSC
ncbi:MAG TPA: hypothetical protein VNZ25_04555 [Candidatus Angelobacter sp.]|jgi:hypothetical protein|nr:hypothetical protein [Candidatus Angelobacter sp.]